LATHGRTTCQRLKDLRHTRYFIYLRDRFFSIGIMVFLNWHNLFIR
jgi:hypothetical protein